MQEVCAAQNGIQRLNERPFSLELDRPQPTTAFKTTPTLPGKAIVANDSTPAKCKFGPTRRAEPYPNLDWTPLHDEIRTLYHVQDKPLADVMHIIKTRHNFIASERSYRTQLQKWGYTKYSTQTCPKQHRRSKSKRVSTSIIAPDRVTTNETDIPYNVPLFTPPPHAVDHTLDQNDRILSSLESSRNGQSRTQLHHAVLREEWKVAELLLNGADVNAIDAHGNEALHYAVSLQNPFTVDRLITYGANVDARGYLGKCPIHIAVSNCSDLEALMGRGTDAPLRDNSACAASFSVAALAKEFNKLAIINSILDAQCDINAVDCFGQTPFQVLVDQPFYAGEKETWVLSFILKFVLRGADPWRHDLVLPNSMTAVEVFFAKSKPTWPIKDHVTNKILHQLLDKGLVPTFVLPSGLSLVSCYFREHFAAQNVDQTLATRFCHTANTDNEHSDGNTILHELSATWVKSRPQSHAQVHIEDLMLTVLHRGSQPNAQNREGQSPLLLLLLSTKDWSNQAQKAMVTLLDHGASPWLPDLKGNCAVFEAIRRFDKQNREVVKLMLQADIGNFYKPAKSSDRQKECILAWRAWYQAVRRPWAEAQLVIGPILQQGLAAPGVEYKVLRSHMIQVVAENQLAAAREDPLSTVEDTVERRKRCATILRDCRSLGVDIDMQFFDDLLRLCV